MKQWDLKKRKKNPYDEPHAGCFFLHLLHCAVDISAGICTAQIHLVLAQEEVADAAKGTYTLHDTSPSQWLRIGLDLKEI